MQVVRPTHSFCYRLPLLAILIGAGLPGAVVLPDGAGKAETVKVCSRCHSMDQTVSLRQGQQGWADTLTKMVNLGAQASNADLNTILNYLAKFYGPVNGTSTEAGSTKVSGTTTQMPASPVEIAARLPVPPAERTEANIPPGGVRVDAASEWRTYGHDAGALRYSPLKQITPENVTRLKVAWVYHMRPPGFVATGRGRGPAVMEGRGPGGAVGDEPEVPSGVRGLGHTPDYCPSFIYALIP